MSFSASAVVKMSASTEFNNCDYWSTNPYMYQQMYNRSNQFYNENSKVNNYNGTGASYQDHQVGFPSMYLNGSTTSCQVKEESAYNTCRYDINQSYSNVDEQTDNSISPPPINHTFTNNLNQFDSCRQVYTSLATTLSTNESIPSSTVNDRDDSPVKIETGESPSALRALLNQPDGKKITYDYRNLHNSMAEAYQKPTSFNEAYSVCRDDKDFKSDTKDLYSKDKVTNDNRCSGEDLAAVQNNFYPWMKSNGKIIFIPNIRKCISLKSLK